MTNLTATLVISLSTNWVALKLPTGEDKEVGIVIESRHARVVFGNKTNDYLQGSWVIGQPALRDAMPITNVMTFRIFNPNQANILLQ